MRSIDAHELENRLQACGTYHGVIAYDNVIATIRDLPTIEPKRKTGKWGFDKGKLVCSVCGARFDHNISDYCNMDNPKHCPDCGARMEGEEE